jgi:hypothetical protein
MYCHPAVMTVWHLNVRAWENVKFWRNSFGTAYVVSVCSCVNSFMGSCLHESAVNLYWKFFIVVFQKLNHRLCLMWYVLTSTRSGNIHSVIKVVTDVCRVINRVLSLHQQAEHHQVSFCGQQVPCLVWTGIQYCRKVIRSFAGNVGSRPARDMYVCLLVSVLYCQVDISAMGWSLIQRNPTKCGLS